MNNHNPQSALLAYFDDLLTEPKPVVTRPASYDERELIVLEQSKHEQLQALLNSRFDTPVPVSAPVVEEPANTPRTTASSTISQYLSWHENGRPHWAQKRFEALLFDVAGLSLAVPLIALGQIQPLTDELTPLFGQAEWFMGLLPTPAGQIRTVNTALFVMPERYNPRFVDTARYVVSIDGVPWGLAVDTIKQPITLDPDDVKWRSERSKRPWLAGTVKSAMCALIDIPQMGQMLMDADKNAPSSW